MVSPGPRTDTADKAAPGLVADANVTRQPLRGRYRALRRTHANLPAALLSYSGPARRNIRYPPYARLVAPSGMMVEARRSS